MLKIEQSYKNNTSGVRRQIVFNQKPGNWKPMSRIELFLGQRHCEYRFLGSTAQLSAFISHRYKAFSNELHDTTASRSHVAVNQLA